MSATEISRQVQPSSTRSVIVGIVMDKLSLGQVFCGYFRFIRYSFHQSVHLVTKHQIYC